MPTSASARGVCPLSLTRAAMFVLAVCALGADAFAAGGTLGVYRLDPGWATFGIAVPRGVVPGGSALRVGALRTQTDIKTTWDDGSVRFAVVTTNVPAPQDYPLSVGRPEAGTFTPIRPDATVEFAINGSRWVARVPAAFSDAWLSGPLVSEARAIVAPMQGAMAHPLLRVIFDVRSYEGGGHRLDITVENVLDVAGADR